MKHQLLTIVTISLLLQAALSHSGSLEIDALQAMEVNGSTQWLLIRTASSLNPVLLYLHGGPGESLVPFAHVASSSLTDRFTVVYWDQRGAGVSLAAADAESILTVEQLIADTLTVVRYLELRFHRRKIYLLGHSWGSTLGSLVVQRSPNEFHAYVGVGQIVSLRSLNQGRYERLTTKAWPLLTPKDKNELLGMSREGRVPIRFIRKYGGFVHNITTDHLPSIMQSSPYCPEKYTRAAL